MENWGRKLRRRIKKEACGPEPFRQPRLDTDRKFKTISRRCDGLKTTEIGGGEDAFRTL